MSHWSAENSAVCHSAGLSIRRWKNRKGSKEDGLAARVHIHINHVSPIRQRGGRDTNGCRLLMCCGRSKGQMGENMFKHGENMCKNHNYSGGFSPSPLLWLGRLRWLHCGCWCSDPTCRAAALHWRDRRGNNRRFHANPELVHPPRVIIGDLTLKALCPGFGRNASPFPQPRRRSVSGQLSEIMQKIKATKTRNVGGNVVGARHPAPQLTTAVSVLALFTTRRKRRGWHFHNLTWTLDLTLRCLIPAAARHLKEPLSSFWWSSDGEVDFFFSVKNPEG